MGASRVGLPAEPGAARLRARAEAQTLAWVGKQKWILAIALDHVTLGLRNAGLSEFLARGLITRAHLHRLDHRPDLARADLDEASALAERGPMPLYQADIQLTRARLFQDRTALADARILITRHEYNRRLPELTDAELAAASWP